MSATLMLTQTLRSWSRTIAMDETSAEPMLILASKSKARRAMLEAAGVVVDCLSPNVDEDALKAGLKAEGVTARNLADGLAEAKAVRLSRRLGPALVVGADQLLALEDETMLDKPESGAFIDQYVDAEWENIRHCVGCYEIEGRRAQLFSDIKGSQFTIMGLPLLHLLDYLRVRGIMPS